MQHPRLQVVMRAGWKGPAEAVPGGRRFIYICLSHDLHNLVDLSWDQGGPWAAPRSGMRISPGT
eukprot:7235366-Pyramimonas_sp.AAC.1